MDAPVGAELWARAPFFISSRVLSSMAKTPKAKSAFSRIASRAEITAPSLPHPAAFVKQVEAAIASARTRRRPWPRFAGQPVS
jgi:hypothetical protein